MKKSVFTLLLLTIFSVATYAQKFALIDMEYILENIPAYESANEQLEQASKQWQAESEKAGQEAKNLYESSQATAKSMTEAQRTQKENEIVEKEKSLEIMRL